MDYRGAAAPKNILDFLSTSWGSVVDTDPVDPELCCHLDPDPDRLKSWLRSQKDFEIGVYYAMLCP